MKKYNWQYSELFDGDIYRFLKDSGNPFNIRLKIGEKKEVPLRLIGITTVAPNSIFYSFRYFLPAKGMRDILVNEAGDVVCGPEYYRVVLYWNHSILICSV